MDNPENKHRPLVRVDIAGEGEKWIDASEIKGMDYDPRVIEMGGEQYFLKFVYYCLDRMGLGTSPENNFEWDVKTFNKFWCDPEDAKNFPLSEPGPGRVQIPVYLFMISKVRGKPLKWACYAVVEEVLRGSLINYQEEYIKDYCRQIQSGILDKL